jgi:hypothetical protein
MNHTLTFEQAQTVAKARGIDLSHNCDEWATECACESSEVGLQGHAPGDTRCPNRREHTACRHDIARLDTIPAHEQVAILMVAELGIKEAYAKSSRDAAEALQRLQSVPDGLRQTPEHRDLDERFEWFGRINAAVRGIARSNRDLFPHHVEVLVMTYHYVVGELYNPDRSSWPEAVQYNLCWGRHELVMFIGSPTPSEIGAVRSGRAEFALLVEGPILFFLYSFEPHFAGRGIDWSEAPFSWHLVPENQRTLPDVQSTPEARGVLRIILVDAHTGIVKALRTVNLAQEFTEQLRQAIQEQAAKAWNAEEYDQALAAAYRKYFKSIDMVKVAAVRCTGGS